MPILVACQNCKTSFNVSEKFAGKQGPCPKCKTIITIPLVKDEIKIHAPEPTGPKDKLGRPVFTPILRQETVYTPMFLFSVSAAVITVLATAIAFRFAGGPPSIFLILGAIGLAPPLGWAAYSMLRNQELEPYRGKELAIRVAICSAVYSLLWALFYWVPQNFTGEPPPYDLFTLTYVVPVMVGIGGLAGYASYDVEYGSGLLHYALYLAVTLLLAWIAGATFMLPRGI